MALTAKDHARQRQVRREHFKFLTQDRHVSARLARGRERSYQLDDIAAHKCRTAILRWHIRTCEYRSGRKTKANQVLHAISSDANMLRCSVAVALLLQALSSPRNAATFLLGFRPSSHLTSSHSDVPRIAPNRSGTGRADRKTRRLINSGGNDGNQDEIERARDDAVIRLPRSDRVRHDLRPI